MSKPNLLEFGLWDVTKIMATIPTHNFCWIWVGVHVSDRNQIVRKVDCEEKNTGFTSCLIRIGVFSANLLVFFVMSGIDQVLS